MKPVIPKPQLPYRRLDLKYPPYRDLSADDSLWSQTGIHLDDGSIDLGNGLRRQDSAHGSVLRGLKKGDLPISYARQGARCFWWVDTDKTQETLDRKSAPVGAPAARGRITAPNGLVVEFTRWKAGAGGAEAIDLQIPGVESPVRVASERPLEDSALETLAASLAEIPVVAFVPSPRIDVVDTVGIADVDGEARPIKALTDPFVHRLTIGRQILLDARTGRAVVHHEMGHIADWEAGSNGQEGDSPKTFSSDHGDFGKGQHLPDRTTAPELSRDDFVSWYAQEGKGEDFAETHALFVEQRTAFNTANPGRDLLHEDPDVVGAWLSPALGRKTVAVAEAYHVLDKRAPVKSQTPPSPPRSHST